MNPLGSGRKKHKVLGVYFTCANIAPHFRSTVDQMQLALLVCEKDFKYFGQDKVFSLLLRDLKILETEGISMADGQVWKGTVGAIIGDNLGSHGIGGFTENFSTSTYFCRFCHVQRNQFLLTPQARVSRRTEESYEADICNIGADNLVSSRGIKFDSVFNRLDFYHVCQPGLPPCLGHDLFEGVLAYDLALCFRNLITKQKLFTYTELSHRICNFKYLGSDAKPCVVNPASDKIGGHAARNWCLIRVLPLLIGDKIDSPLSNDIWQLMLLLRRVIELTCAPTISHNQIAYLRVLIEDYLELRKQAFPLHPLKPKHHYISHYADLTIRFGPLIRLWTLRFESKHSYFKQCAHKLHNFKNICLTLAERHQLLQAYLSVTNIFPKEIEVRKSTDFFADDYNNKIQECVAEFCFLPENTVAANEVTVKGTTYTKNLCIVVAKDNDGIVFGRIKLILIHNGSVVYFLTEQCHSVLLVDQGIQRLNDPDPKYLCISHSKLLDYYPLPEYRILGLSLIALHHSFPAQDD